MPAEQLLDDTGWRILQLLQEQGRLSFTEIGRQVGRSAPAVAERVRRLEDAGVITGYRAVVDPAKLGYPILAFIRVSLSSEYRSGEARAMRAAQALAEVLECHHITGNDCLLAKVAVASIPHLEAVINQFTPYGQTTTSVVLSSEVTARVIAPCPSTD